MDAHSNVESLSFSLDGLAKKVRIYTILDPITHKIPIPIPVPNINVFKPPLGARPTPPAKVEFAKDVAQLQPDEAARGILGFLMNNSDAINASGTLDVLRYGRVLRSRLLVGVRGAGLAYDGMYYVDSVATARRVQGELRAVARRSHLHHAAGAAMSNGSAAGRYLGKYRGTVINNIDPLLRGRLLLEVPDVTSLTPTSWAEPCVPLAGPTGGECEPGRCRR
jgi:hypothetical protein